MYIRIPAAQKSGLHGFATNAVRKALEVGKAKQAAQVSVPVSTATPQYTYITTSGFAKRPIAVSSGVVSSGPKYTPVIRDPRAMPPISQDLIDRGISLPELTARMTSEELTRLRDQELLTAQEKESGPINVDLENKAAENDAVSRAVQSGDTGHVLLTQETKKDNWLPLILAAAMAYFIT